jgi:hypothetical protein
VNLFAPAGTATPGDDYSGMSTSVSIPSGEDHVDFTVTPVDDDAPEDAESVVAILKADAAYRLGAVLAAATIADNDNLTAGPSMR